MGVIKSIYHTITGKKPSYVESMHSYKGDLNNAYHKALEDEVEHVKRHLPEAEQFMPKGVKFGFVTGKDRESSTRNKGGYAHMLFKHGGSSKEYKKGQPMDKVKPWIDPVQIRGEVRHALQHYLYKQGFQTGKSKDDEKLHHKNIDRVLAGRSKIGDKVKREVDKFKKALGQDILPANVDYAFHHKPQAGKIVVDPKQGLTEDNVHEQLLRLARMHNPNHKALQAVKSDVDVTKGVDPSMDKRKINTARQNARILEAVKGTQPPIPKEHQKRVEEYVKDFHNLLGVHFAADKLPKMEDLGKFNINPKLFDKVDSLEGKVALRKVIHDKMLDNMRKHSNIIPEGFDNKKVMKDISHQYLVDKMYNMYKKFAESRGKKVISNPYIKTDFNAKHDKDFKKKLLDEILNRHKKAFGEKIKVR